MRILPSARKHGMPDADILHAWDYAIRLVQHEYLGKEILLAIGPDRSGALLELVLLPPDDPERIIHADRLRPSRYDALR